MGSDKSVVQIIQCFNNEFLDQNYSFIYLFIKLDQIRNKKPSEPVTFL